MPGRVGKVHQAGLHPFSAGRLEGSRREWETVSGNVLLTPTGSGQRTRQPMTGRDEALPMYLTADETADLLRTTRKAIYAMVERGQLPGVTRVGRRILMRSCDMLNWLNQKRAPSPKE